MAAAACSASGEKRIAETEQSSEANEESYHSNAIFDIAEADELLLIDVSHKISECDNGEALFTICTNELPLSGNKTGRSLSMNRATVVLKSLGKMGNSTQKAPAWSSCTEVQKQAVRQVFHAIEDVNLPLLKTAILKGFPSFSGSGPRKKQRVVTPAPAAAVGGGNTTSLPFHAESGASDHDDESLPDFTHRNTSASSSSIPNVTVDAGTVVNRTALLACALADPQLTLHWNNLFAPVAPELRPGMLDVGAPQVSEARWEVMARMIMDKARDYVNEHDDLNLPLYGRVLKAVRPQDGSFVATAALSRAAQLQQLTTRMRSRLSTLEENLSCSGKNNTDDEQEAFVYCGAENRPKDIGLFFFWLCLRHRDHNFMRATLLEDEEAGSAARAVDAGRGNGRPSASTNSGGNTQYKMRKDREIAKQNADNLRHKQETLELCSSMSFSPSGGSSAMVIDDSVKAKNFAAANEKDRLAALYEEKAKTEQLERIKTALTNPEISALLGEEGRDKARTKLLALLIGPEV
jgi:hypothetical protein